MVRMLIRTSDGVDRLVRVLAVPIGTAFILIVFSGVVMRYVFQAPIISSIELARIGFVWSCFLGAAICVKKEKHIQFSFLLDSAGVAKRRWMKLVITFLSAAFFLLLVVKGVQMVQKVEGTYFPALGYSQAWLYLPLPPLLSLHAHSRPGLPGPRPPGDPILAGGGRGRHDHGPDPRLCRPRRLRGAHRHRDGPCRRFRHGLLHALPRAGHGPEDGDGDRFVRSHLHPLLHAHGPADECRGDYRPPLQLRPRPRGARPGRHGPRQRHLQHDPRRHVRVGGGPTRAGWGWWWSRPCTSRATARSWRRR